MYNYDIEEAHSGQKAIDLVINTIKKECYCKNRTFKIILM